jgi:hypothetical protein
MKKLSLPRAAIKKIHAAVDRVFDRAIQRFLARPPVDKRIYLAVKPRVTLASLFEAASTEERVRADKGILATLLDIAESFIDSQRHSTKAQVVKSVEAWLNKPGVDTNVETVLGGELAGVFGKATDGMKRIVAAESNNAKNTGTLDGIIRVNAASNIDDPVVYFVVVRDDDLCEECRRLHLDDDGVTPRLYRLSELGHGYHKKGEENPKVGGLHPFCRCGLITLMPGYGFNAKGMITYIKPDHDELAGQRKVKKSEAAYEGLEKSRPESIKTFHANKERWHENGLALEAEKLAPEHHEIAQNARLTLNFPLDEKTTKGLSKAGRFLNQYETGTSKGSYDPHGIRPTYEKSVLGIPHEVPHTERPVYGAIAHKPWHAHVGGAGCYGHGFAIMKPHVHNRISITPEDSFDSEPHEVYLHKHLPHIVSGLEQVFPGHYVEAQVHGGIDLSQDVESLNAQPDTSPEDLERLVELGRKHNLPVYHHKVNLPDGHEKEFEDGYDHLEQPDWYDFGKARRQDKNDHPVTIQTLYEPPAAQQAPAPPQTDPPSQAAGASESSTSRLPKAGPTHLLG